MAIIGKIEIDGLQFVTVDSDPTIGLDLPIGTIAILNTGAAGKFYIKMGALQTDWEQSVTASGAVTASRALTSDASGRIVASTTTAAELLFVNGVTSAIQTQLNNKQTIPIINSTTTTQASTSTTYGNITELITTSLAIGKYRVHTMIRYQSAATGAGMGVRIAQGTATIGTVAAQFSVGGFAADGAGQTFQYTQTALADNKTSSATLVANTTYLTTGIGFIDVTVAGTVAIQFRTEVNGTAVTIQSNSHVILERIV